jgi:photosystem II stability/assembly factor-like uncharacterized protein
VSTTAAYLSMNLLIQTGSQPQAAPLWYTADGGRTWSARHIDCGFPALSVALSVAPDGALVGVCAGQPSAGSQAKSTVVSADGGFEWTTGFSCAGFSKACLDAPLAFGYLGEIDAVSARTVWLVGGRSSLLVTRDGGAHWASVQPLIGDTGGGTSAVVFFSPRVGIVLGEDGTNNELPTIWSTDDGGGHWTSVVPKLAT